MSLRPEPVKTVENLNPKSRAVKGMEMTVKRAIMLNELMHEIYSRVGDKEKMKDYPPAGWGYAPFIHSVMKGTMHTALVSIWGDSYWTHPEYQSWPMLVDMWSSGSLDSQILALSANLPSKMRKKLDV